MRDVENATGSHARLLTAEQKIRENSDLALQIAEDITGVLRKLSPSLPGNSEAYLRDRTSEQEYDTRYHVGIEQSYRSGLFRSFRYKLLQIHLHSNFQSVVARITQPEGHTFENGIALSGREQAAEVFSRDYLLNLAQGRLVDADEAYLVWKSEGGRLSFFS